jgi:hypothetical protein
MVTVHYRRWCPQKSPLRIEFLPHLLNEVRLDSARPVRSKTARWIPRLNRVENQCSGLLFGVLNDGEVRVLAAGGGACLAPLDMTPLGIFVCRERGEVFLTDDDLARFEKHQGVIALVVAGGRTGFFVREMDGSVQAIRSHEEFQLADVAPRLVFDENPTAELPAPAPRWRSWRRIAACAGLLAVPAAAFAYLRPLLPRGPIAVALREEAGQLVIGWNQSAVTEGSRLEIMDGSERTIVQLPANTSSATYGPQGGDVEVRLTTDSGMGGAHWEAARFARRPERKPPSPALGVVGLDVVQDQIGALSEEAKVLRRSLAQGQARAESLAAKLGALTVRPEP